jgi:DNA-binding MarR family transcriptional regulator
MPRKPKTGAKRLARPERGQRPTPFEDVDALDRIVHEPARLAIMAYLSVLAEADFVYLMNETGLTRGNLSSHMSKLEESGYVAVEKTFVGKTPRTVLSLTGDGRRALAEWRERMAEVVEALPSR